MITIRDLHIGYRQGRFQKTIARLPHLDLRPGEVLCILGANGMGKTTFLKTILKLLPSLGGHITIDGIRIEDLSPKARAKKMAYVPSHIAFPEYMTVLEYIDSAHYPYRTWKQRLFFSKGISREALDGLLKGFHLERLANREIDSLSDGEKKRAMLARAFFQGASCLILDEPTAHLDLATKYEIEDFMRNFMRTGKKFLIYSTHDPGLALRFSERLMLFQKNREAVLLENPVRQKKNRKKNLRILSDGFLETADGDKGHINARIRARMEAAFLEALQADS